MTIRHYRRRSVTAQSTGKKPVASIVAAGAGRNCRPVMLEEIERAGLFLVPLDEVRGWWRYHHLFADLLRARLQAEQLQSRQAKPRRSSTRYPAANSVTACSS